MLSTIIVEVITEWDWTSAEYLLFFALCVFGNRKLTYFVGTEMKP